MPVLSNPRRERFAQYLAAGMPQVEAYEKAGYARDTGAAARVSAIASVRQRVAELLRRNIAKQDAATTVTVEQLQAELEAARAGAMESGRYNDAVAAITAKAKLGGLWVERSE